MSAAILVSFVMKEPALTNCTGYGTCQNDLCWLAASVGAEQRMITNCMRLTSIFYVTNVIRKYGHFAKKKKVDYKSTNNKDVEYNSDIQWFIRHALLLYNLDPIINTLHEFSSLVTIHLFACN